MLNTKKYSGYLSISEYGDSEDVLFLSSVDEPFLAELEWITGKNVGVRFWSSHSYLPDDELKMAATLEIMGLAESEFRPVYSEYTGYLWTDQNLNIGGHNLLRDLNRISGCWVLIEIDYE